MKNTFQNIIKAICDELKIECTFLSNNWIIMLRKNDITKFITGHKFDLNNHALGNVLDDKYAMYEVLKSQNIEVIEHNLVYGPNNKNKYAASFNNIEYLKDLFKKYNNDIVLKVNNGTCGINVEHLTTLESLNEAYIKMSTPSNSLSLCPYYDIEYEFRVIILNNKIKLMYKKQRPIVVGDGKSTIKELLIKFNSSYFNDYNEPNKNTILKENEIYMYDWKFNLSRGSKTSEEINSTDRNEVSLLALKTAKKLNLGFCSVDIIKCNNKFYVLEINSGVMMKNYIEQAKDGYSKSYNIYKEAIIEMFK